MSSLDEIETQIEKEMGVRSRGDHDDDNDEADLEDDGDDGNDSLSKSQKSGSNRLSAKENSKGKKRRKTKA